MSKKIEDLGSERSTWGYDVIYREPRASRISSITLWCLNYIRAWKVTLWVKLLAARPDGMRVIPEILVVKREKLIPLSCSLSLISWSLNN